MTAGTICDNAYYCSGEATDSVTGVTTTEGNVFGMPCPAGSFGDQTRSFTVDGVTYTDGRGRLTSSDCDVCTEKYYCDEVGTTEVVGLCARGFMCATGSDRSGPYVTTYIKPALGITGQSGMCEAGTYCQYGQDQQDCLATNYTISPQQSDCLYCPPGHYCLGGTHIDTCTLGYYCEEKSSTPTPDPTNDASHTGMGDLCPTSSFCTTGVGQPLACPDGYQ